MTGPRFRTISVDPPWPQKKAGPLRGGVGEFFAGATVSQPMPYQTMTIAQIKALPVPDYAEDDSVLYLWTTQGFIEDAFDVLRHWGFRKSALLTWCKTPMGGGLGGDYGITTEFFIYARRGKPKAIGRMNTTWFQWKRHYENGHPKHSAKPHEFYSLVERVSPGLYLELFGRYWHPGWVQLGDEVQETLFSAPSLLEHRENPAAAPSARPERPESDPSARNGGTRTMTYGTGTLTETADKKEG